MTGSTTGRVGDNSLIFLSCKPHQVLVRVVASVALFGLAAALVLVFFLLLRNNGPETRLIPYVNDAFGYEIYYPQAWHTEIRQPQPNDDFVYQYFRATGAEGSIQVVINLQGGWCEGPIPPPSIKEVDISGVKGMEYECPENQQIVRDFRGGLRQNFTVLGSYNADNDARFVKKLVESFRFVR